MPFPLNLAALAQEGLGETQRRGQAGLDANASALQTGLAQSGAQDQATADAAGRDQTFQRAQAMLSEALARREENMRQADAMARQRFEEQQGALQRQFLGGEAALNRTADAQAKPDWYAQQRFQTDENIRQATTMAGIQHGYDLDSRDEAAAAKEAESKPRLSDFGSYSINPYRGQALMDSGHKGLTPEELRRAEKYLKDSDYDPAAFQKKLRDVGWKPKKASIAMWNLLGGNV